MPDFFSHFSSSPAEIFLLDEKKALSITYQKAGELIDTVAETIKSSRKKLAFLFCDNSYQTIINYLGILKSGHCVLLLDQKLNSNLKSKLISIYSPEIIFSPEEIPADEYFEADTEACSLYTIKHEKDFPPVFDQLAVLLSTSGTTGSPKLVRLSYNNLLSNAHSIVQSLGIGNEERAVTSLSMSYSYGLSVINSHLLAGASLMLTDKSFVFRDFWDAFNKYSCTSFAGVPYSYELLTKTSFNKLKLPTLKILTQAGGRLNKELTDYFYQYSLTNGIKLYLMYGQTEATARISYLPFESLPVKAGSIGVPVPGGSLRVMADGTDITGAGKTGELVYSGPNVMLGYAEKRDDLARGDEMNGVLLTGDLGYMSEDCFFYIAGRLKRFIKIMGLRVNLDDIETMLKSTLNADTACTGNDSELQVLISCESNTSEHTVLKSIAFSYGIKSSIINVKKGVIPFTISGKKDYKTCSSFF